MTRKQLVLDRYEIMGTAGTGGFGTVQIAWDPRIQRKVAIKTIQLTERDVERAALSGAQSGAQSGVQSGAHEETVLPESKRSLSDSSETVLLEAEPLAQKALSPSEARSARLSAQQQAEEEYRALSLSWENPWVRIPDDANTSADSDEIDHTEMDERGASAEEGLSLPSEDTFARQQTGEIGAPAQDEAVPPGVHAGLDAASIPSVTQELSSVQDNRPLSERLPSVIRLPEVEAENEQRTQELELPSLSTEVTAEIPAIEEEPSECEPEHLEVMESIAEEDTRDEDRAEDAPIDDGLDNPSIIIAEARASLKDLTSFKAHSTGNVRYPWEDDPDQDDVGLRPRESTQLLDEPSSQSAIEQQMQRSQSEHLSVVESDDEPLTTLVRVPGLDEARTAAKLSDQRIVTVYDFEVRDRTAYLIMEYVEGITLSQLLDDYPNYITLDMVTGVFDAVAGALEVAHDAGVLHLDIKPDNIIINRDGQVKVTDFGLATLADASGHGFAGGGTIGYMPLEQMRREELDVRTDEWALASMTYEMLTGGNPFRARTLDQAQQAILNAELVLPSLCWPRVDSQLDDVLFYALDPDREERYESIGDFADEVDKFLGDPGSGQEQLALVVEDALRKPDMPDVQEVQPRADKASGGQRTGVWGIFDRFGLGKRASSDREPRRERTRFVDYDDDRNDGYPEFGPSDRLAQKLSKYGPDDALYEDDYEEYEEEKEPVEHIPLYQRVPESFIMAGAHIFSGIGCAFVTGLAFWNFEPIRSIPDAGAYIGTIIGAVIFGLLGVIVPAYGALVSFCLLGIVICLCGHPIVGAVLIIVTGLWWYILGRDGVGENNIALLGPLSMSIGAASITPLFAGVTLKPLQAALTTFYSVLLVCIFSSFGGDSFIGWDALGYPTLSGSDVTLAFARMFTRPLTYTMAIGWIGGAVLFSLLNLKSSRWTFIVGLILCVACVLAGTLIFTAPTPQLFVSVVVGAGILLAIFL